MTSTRDTLVRDEMSLVNQQHVADVIPPARIDPNRAGVHPEFLAAWQKSVRSELALCEFESEEFPVPSLDEQPQTFTHAQHSMSMFDLDTKSDTKYQFKPVWSRSF